ncbi:acetate/propionate family kinase [Sinorhizobium saheli]|jgi:acetate kinase|uniref:Acetate kinase n=1 Tax=Sinorhizobium saheli TaxID=36856 RepID=A0A178YN97_SINSA|nr:acetate/propionate family kinase [Sinorhizobium saheli]MQW86461.1 acetate/propionate family kinase [Sinorhizobium saheli]OAP48235.1 acetate kinase [Sinorhizobium saheli]
MQNGRLILILNGGSSSLKFAVCESAGCGSWILRGRFERIGTSGTLFVVTEGRTETCHDAGSINHGTATSFLLGWLEKRLGLLSIAAVGHRVVHGGMKYQAPDEIDDAMIAELRRLRPFAPEHLPTELDIISACTERLEGVLQVACFDTAFHRDMPAVARMLPIPRRFNAEGVVRYGFHGISYTHILESVRRDAPERATTGRLIFAHLGNGASLAAVKDGKSIDTTMGFTPAAGIPMSTRSGDLDPGIFLYLVRNSGVDADSFDRMMNHRAGLLGVSETSGDLRDLLDREESDGRAAEAVGLFCYSVKKQIGAYAAALGGLDVLVFTGGIGQHSPVIRQRICDGLGFLGIELDPTRNASAKPVISAAGADVEVRVIAADEEAVIAAAVKDILTRKEPSR